MGKFDGLRGKKSTTAEPPKPEAAQARRPGRPSAKRSNPDFVQVTAYVPAVTYGLVKRDLLGDGIKTREFSVLVDELLTEWLKRPQSERDKYAIR